MPPTALATALVRMRHVRDSVRDSLLASPATRPGWVLPTLVGAPQLLLAACLVFRGVRERTRRRKQQRGGLHGGGRFQRVALAPSESEPPSPHLTQGIEGVSELLSRQAAAHADLLRPQRNANGAVAAVAGGGGGFRLTEKQRDLLSRAVVAPPPGMPAAPLPTPPPQLLPWTAATAAAAAAAAGPRPATPSDSTAAAAASAALASAQARLQERLLLESRAALPPTAAAALVAAATAPTSLVGATVPASRPRVPPSVATASDVDGAARRGMERVRHEHAVQQERAAALQQAASSELEARFRSRVEAAQTQTQCGSSHIGCDAR